MPGSLTVVGTGIQMAGQLTAEARIALESADEVLCIPGELVSLRSLERLNSNTRSLHTLYEPGRPRIDTYRAMVDEILAAVRRGGNVCVALYGHPGVFAWPSHESIRRARAEGLTARMLPAVSAEDCLFADLGVDPGECGCQSYEATDFLVRDRKIDTSAVLVLWQVGVVGSRVYAPEGDTSRLHVLVDCLCALYAPDHEVVLYVAAAIPRCKPKIQRLALSEILGAEVAPGTTLYVPPLHERRVDEETALRLGFGQTRAGSDSNPPA